ncbi:MAG: Sterol-binding domain protein [Proteobacteria bacterium]|nr:MAG: Sterol-binding domain protein [Pseudomonadota bacterium]
MIATALSTLLEKALNFWLKLDARTHGDALQQLQALQGKLIALHISQPTLTLYFMPTSTDIRVMTHHNADPDVSIYGSALALMRMSTAEDSNKAMLEQGIRIEGDLGTGERFSAILRSANLDWEELLAQSIGDTAAHQIGSTGRAAQNWLKDTTQSLTLNTQEYLQEEIHLLPSSIEVQYFKDEVDTLRLDTERLAARINRLVANRQNKKV